MQEVAGRWRWLSQLGYDGAACAPIHLLSLAQSSKANQRYERDGSYGDTEVDYSLGSLTVPQPARHVGP
jgi:hypothetical protein